MAALVWNGLDKHTIRGTKLKGLKKEKEKKGGLLVATGTATPHLREGHRIIQLRVLPVERASSGKEGGVSGKGYLVEREHHLVACQGVHHTLPLN